MSKNFDRYAGIVFLALGAAFMAQSMTLSQSAYGSNVGPNVFPFGLGLFVSLMSLRLIYETFRYKRQESKKEVLDYKRFGIIFAAAVLYAFFLEDIGFVISTFLFLMIGFQTMERGRIWTSVIISLGFSVGVYFLYVDVMDGTLPGFPAWLGLS